MRIKDDKKKSKRLGTYFSLEGWLKLRCDSIEYGGDRKAGKKPLAGVSARLEAGSETKSRITATRVLAVGVFALAAKKKSGGESWMIVEGPDFYWTIKVNRDDQYRARDFVGRVNQAARVA